MHPKVCRDLLIAGVVFAVLALSYMSTSMNSGEWIRTVGNTASVGPLHNLNANFKGVLSQGLWNKCTSVQKQGPIQEAFACCSNLQSADFHDKSYYEKLKTVQTLIVFSAAATGLGALLVFVTLGTKNRGAKIASVVFVGLGAVLAIAGLSVYSEYWKNAKMIKQQPDKYVMGWGQSLYIAATVFSVISTVLVGVTLAHTNEQNV